MTLVPEYTARAVGHVPSEKLTVYLSGPMSNIPEFNYPAFNAYAERYRKEGYNVISPAESDGVLDRTLSTPAIGSIDPAYYAEFMRKDLGIFVSHKIDRVYLMPGWHKSRGAQLERHIAELLNIPLYDAETGQPYDESITQEAHRLVHGNRGAAYGHPFYDFGRTAGMLTHLLSDKLAEGKSFNARDVWMIMVCVKLSRERNKPNRDNRVDMAGYADTGEMVEQMAKKLGISLT